MAKMVRCNDIGIDCDFVVRGETPAEVLKNTAEHVAAIHDLKVIPPETMAVLQLRIRDEK